MLIYYLFDPNNKYVCVTKTLVNISGSVYKYQTRWNSTVTYITGYKQRNYLLSGNWRHQDICRPPLFKRIDCKLLEALLEAGKPPAQTEKKNEAERDMSLQQRPIVWALLNGSSSHISVTAEDAHQAGPIGVHQLHCTVLSLRLSGSVHWSTCCSLQNTSTGQSGSNCLLRDIKAPKVLVHLLCSGAGQKEEEQQEEKRLWTRLPASVYSLSF